jgi:hypothetical protein
MQAAKRQSLARPHGLSMGGAFVRGRLAGARRGRTLAMYAYAACGCALAATTLLLWIHADQAPDGAVAAASIAIALWLAGWLPRR